MCLAIPMKIIEINGKKALVEADGLKYMANLEFLSDVRVGDYVIIHAGFAIQKLDAKAAKETLAIFKEIL
ncbi:MAG: HypC/HybG/HupF family hydrogenase formation chaperone [Candidatus Omnitrophica bacterium]|nr:HypC/HybG/HupF family hydrogenase formation chaperone [Candidatus Omnitrophota bacterium]